MRRESAGITGAYERAEGLADLLKLSYEPMIAWRLDGPIEFWNAGAERLYGYAAQEAVGRSSHALLQTTFPGNFAELRTRLRDAGHWSGELRHVCKDGRAVVVDSRMQVLADDTVLEVNRDVTEIQALIARQAALLREQQATVAKFEALFNQSGIFAGIMDLQGCLREANDLSRGACVLARRRQRACRRFRPASDSRLVGGGGPSASDRHRRHGAQANRGGLPRQSAGTELARRHRRIERRCDRQQGSQRRHHELEPGGGADFRLCGR
jgi:PAS domain S-box-containing protein